jgi:D-alanyl-D-alanine dipeptidase
VENAEDTTTNNISAKDTTSKDTSAIISEQAQKYKQMGLRDVQEEIPGLKVELKYSTADNFLGFDVYGDLQRAFLQPECIAKLKAAYNLLQQKMPGYTFIVYDALRPAYVQQLMWDTIDVPEHKKFWYVAPPGKGSIHNYGMAVDVTIADSSGNPLDMGTPFDYFGEKAFPRYTQKFVKNGELTQQQADNRKLLISIMHAAGFTVARTEWWHFNATSLANAKTRFDRVE